jgi:16S rRNA U516 pseudouridylate synthase RsuA-like enzyme
MFEAIGYRVKRLRRVRIGNLRLADLPCGHWRALTKRELEGLRKTGSAPVRVDRPHGPSSSRHGRLL